MPIDYDPLLAKLSVWAHTRDAAIARMSRALFEYRAGGITTNLSFFGHLMADEEWRRGDLDTGFIERFFERLPAEADHRDELLAAILAAVQASSTESGRTAAQTPANSDVPSRWRAAGAKALLR